MCPTFKDRPQQKQAKTKCPDLHLWVCMYVSCYWGKCQMLSWNAVLILHRKMAVSTTFPPLSVVTSSTRMQFMFRAYVRAEKRCFYRLQFDGNELWKFCWHHKDELCLSTEFIHKKKAKKKKSHTFPHTSQLKASVIVKTKDGVLGMSHMPSPRRLSERERAFFSDQGRPHRYYLWAFL